MEEVHFAGAALKIATLNINALRGEGKRTLLGGLLGDFPCGVCILTETHLKSEGLGNIKFQ